MQSLYESLPTQNGGGIQKFERLELAIPKLEDPIRSITARKLNEKR